MVSSYQDGRITLTVGPRPGKRSVSALQNPGLTHCCTLLSAREGAEQVRDFCKKLGNEGQPCEWLWLPIEGGNIATLQATDMKTLMAELISAIEAHKAPHVYIHCSAGIHRTGFVTYLLLRLLGESTRHAQSKLKELRESTFNQVGHDRLVIAEEMLKSWG